MADEPVYRPEKRRLTMSELNQDDQDTGNDENSEDQDVSENLQSLQSMRDVQRAAAAELGKNVELPGEDAPFKVKGNVPPGFAAMMQGANPANAPTPSRAAPPRPKNRSRPELAATGDVQLDELLGRLKRNYEPISLPSKGRFYNGEDGPTDGVLHVKPMTGEEEQILATPRYVKKGKAIDMIFSNCVRERIVPESLLTVDRTFLLIFLRGISYTADYDVEVKCPACGSQFSTTIDLNTIEVDECPDDFSQDSLEDVLPKSGFKFVYRLSRGDDEARVSKYREDRVRNFGDQVIDDTLAFRTSLLVEEIEGLKDQRKIQMLAKSLPIDDMNYIRNLVNDPPFGVKTDIPMDCPNCFERFTVDLPMESNFFFPKRKKAESRA